MPRFQLFSLTNSSWNVHVLLPQVHLSSTIHGCLLPCRPRDSSSVEQGVEQTLFHQLIGAAQHGHGCPLTPSGAQQGDVWNRVLVGKTIQTMTGHR